MGCNKRERAEGKLAKQAGDGGGVSRCQVSERRKRQHTATNRLSRFRSNVAREVGGGGGGSEGASESPVFNPRVKLTLLTPPRLSCLSPHSPVLAVLHGEEAEAVRSDSQAGQRALRQPRHGRRCEHSLCNLRSVPTLFYLFYPLSLRSPHRGTLPRLFLSLASFPFLALFARALRRAST